MELNHGLLRDQPLGRLKLFIIDICAAYLVLIKLSNGLATAQVRHLTTAQIRTMFGMETSTKDLSSIRWLGWLGPTARISEDRITKKL